MIPINKILTTSQLEFINSLFNLSQGQMKEFLNSFLRKYYDKVYTTKKYVYAVGEQPVALVAHMDVVYQRREKIQIYYDMVQGVLWSPSGLGADDRAGIYAILKIINAGYRPSVIFTTDEETGGLGAKELVKDYAQPLSQLKYIIELDRQGSIDCVFYDCDNPDFVKYIEEFGFISDWGTYSDISEICPKWEIAGVNLSIGYLQEHSLGEHLKLSWMNSTIDKVKEMIKDIDNAQEYKYIYGSRYGYSRFYNGLWNDHTIIQCNKCKNHYDETDIVAVMQPDQTFKHYCIDCLDGNISWCDYCDHMYAITEGHSCTNMCPRCKEAAFKK